MATEALKFYLGTHQIHWLAQTAVPLFVTRTRLALRKSLPRATCPWALDSGGYSELQKYGKWSAEPAAFADEVRHYADEIGNMVWVATQDWLCTPDALKATGLTVGEHQRRTVESYLRLVGLAPSIPWVPSLQGWTPGDYYRHIDMYARAGVDLQHLPRVGLGSVAARQDSPRITALIEGLHHDGIKLHAFGFKTKGLLVVERFLASADSLAWSYRARRREPLPGHTHVTCNSCLDYALMWRAALLKRLDHRERIAEMVAF